LALDLTARPLSFQFSVWVQKSILSPPSAKKRASVVDSFVKMGVTFQKLNNFNGIMQIVSAMEGAAVHRLQKTFEKVRPKSRTKYAEMHELMSSSGSFKFYREVRDSSICFARSFYAYDPPWR